MVHRRRLVLSPLDNCPGNFLQHQKLLDVPAIHGCGGIVHRRNRDVPGIQVPDQRNAGAFGHAPALVFCGSLGVVIPEQFIIAR